MMTNKCPDCHGTGEYIGLNVREPCKTCGGNPVETPVLDTVKAVQLTDSTWGVVVDYTTASVPAVGWEIISVES